MSIQIIQVIHEYRFIHEYARYHRAFPYNGVVLLKNHEFILNNHEFLAPFHEFVFSFMNSGPCQQRKLSIHGVFKIHDNPSYTYSFS